jgi:hypothetical protein
VGLGGVVVGVALAALAMVAASRWHNRGARAQQAPTPAGAGEKSVAAVTPQSQASTAPDAARHSVDSGLQEPSAEGGISSLGDAAAFEPPAAVPPPPQQLTSPKPVGGHRVQPALPSAAVEPARSSSGGTSTAGAHPGLGEQDSMLAGGDAAHEDAMHSDSEGEMH